MLIQQRSRHIIENMGGSLIDQMMSIYYPVLAAVGVPGERLITVITKILLMAVWRIARFFRCCMILGMVLAQL